MAGSGPAPRCMPAGAGGTRYRPHPGFDSQTQLGLGLLCLSTRLSITVMDRPWILDYDTANCSIGAAVGVIGEKWTFLILRESFNGVRRFGDMQRRIQAPRQI